MTLLDGIGNHLDKKSMEYKHGVWDEIVQGSFLITKASLPLEGQTYAIMMNQFWQLCYEAHVQINSSFLNDTVFLEQFLLVDMKGKIVNLDIGQSGVGPHFTVKCCLEFCISLEGLKESYTST